MVKKSLALTLTLLLTNLLCAAPITAVTKPEDEARFAEKVKTEIAKLGTGPRALVEVRLRDKTKLKGYIGEADATRFAVVDTKTGTSTMIAYAQVKTVKGNNMSTGEKIAIGAAISVVVFILICAASGRCQE